MPESPRYLRAFLTASFSFTIVVTTFALHVPVDAQDESCIGKPYPSPGCPVMSVASSSSAAKSASDRCGNNLVEEGEECDMGRFNGQRNCSDKCTWLMCGDGILMPRLGEECEPVPRAFYGAHPVTGELVVIRKFVEGTCGQVCAIPTCDASGKNCTGGCRNKFLAECPAPPPVVSPPATVPHAAAPSSAPTSVAPSSAPSAQPLQFAARSQCGNGIVEQGEKCDDGNLVHSDACSNLCQVARCGDAIVQVGEQCDDGNQIASDACSPSCVSARCGDGTVQTGESCDDGNPVNTDACSNQCRSPTCGDGIIQYGEECDDGNQINIDACSNSCQNARCGDRILQRGEECDDGNVVNTDACTTTCRRALCGDGIVQVGEQCDDGNQISTDACTNACKHASCGNGVREASEECDDGNDTPTDGCSNSCKLPVCGNGVREEGEECDAGSKNSAVKPNACRDDCSVAHCGDSVVDSGEECDGSDGCLEACSFESFVSAGGSTSILLFVGLGSVGIAAFLGVALRSILLTKGKPRSRRGGRRKGGDRSIDDIPLDEIEMPWHSW